MDIATIVGAVVAFGLVGGSVAMGGGAAFINAPSAMIVIGGTAGAIMLATSMDNFKGLGTVFSKALGSRTWVDEHRSSIRGKSDRVDQLSREHPLDDQATVSFEKRKDLSEWS